MIARWREQGLVAGPEWHWAFVESRAARVELDAATAHRLRLEAERRDATVCELIHDLLDADRRYPSAMTA